MPAINVYVSKEMEACLKARAIAEGEQSCAPIIKKALESYLGLDEQQKAKMRVMTMLMGKKPFGDKTLDELSDELEAERRDPDDRC